MKEGALGVSITVSDRGEDYDIEVIRDNPSLSIRVVCTDSNGDVAYLPRMSSEDALELASLLSMAADATG